MRKHSAFAPGHLFHSQASYLIPVCNRYKAHRVKVHSDYFEDFLQANTYFFDHRMPSNLKLNVRQVHLTQLNLLFEKKATLIKEKKCLLQRKEFLEASIQDKKNEQKNSSYKILTITNKKGE